MKSFSQTEFEFCKNYTNYLLRHPLAVCFLVPVNPERDNAPNYYKIITNPMDLGTLHTNLLNGKYSNVEEWENDILLVFSNAKTYNKSGTFIHEVADILEKKAKKAFERIPKNSIDKWQYDLMHISDKIAKMIKLRPKELNLIPIDQSLAITPQC